MRSAHAALRRLGAPRLRRPRRGAARGRRGAARAHVDELVPGLVAEQGKTVREARIELRKAADTLEHYAGLAQGGPRRVRPRPRPRRRRPRAAPAARRRRRDRAVELPDDAAVQQARPGAACAATRSSPSPPTRRRSRRCGWPRSSPRRGCRRACSTSSPAPGPRRARRSSPTRSRARSRSRARRRPASASMALAAHGTKRVTLELGGSDPMIICDDADLARGGERGRAWAASTTAARRAWRSSASTCSTSVADEVIEAIAAKAARLRVGLGTDEGAQLGPMHSERQRDAHGGPDRADAAARRRAGRRRRAPGRRAAGAAAGSTSRPSSSTRRTTRRWRARRSSGPPCRSGACRTSTRRSSWPTTRRSAWGRRCGRRASSAPSARPPRSTRGYTWINSPTKVYDELPFGGVGGQRLRQGARLGGARLLHRPEVGRGQARRMTFRRRRRRRRAGGLLRVRAAAGRWLRRRSHRPAADAVRARALGRRTRPSEDQERHAHVREDRAARRLPLLRRRRARDRHHARGAARALPRGPLRDRDRRRQPPRDPRRGPARLVSRHPLRGLVQRPPRRLRRGVRPRRRGARSSSATATSPSTSRACSS